MRSAVSPSKQLCTSGRLIVTSVTCPRRSVSTLATCRLLFPRSVPGKLQKMGPDRFDAVVVGGGPAGLAAATWIARHRRRVTVLDSREYRNRWVERAHGYLGLDPVRPTELVARRREALARYPSARL